jgi:putative toxin-antitoxin system antitoxin component (TIGR02293 family)
MPDGLSTRTESIITIPAPIVADRLGGPRTLGRQIRNLTDLRHAIEAGLPVESLEMVTRYLAEDTSEATDLKHAVVPKTTLRRRTRLSTEESERTERLARLVALAEHVWEDPSLAREFLTSAQPQLDGARPIDLARTELGAQEVEELLMKIEYALPV